MSPRIDPEQIGIRPISPLETVEELAVRIQALDSSREQAVRLISDALESLDEDPAAEPSVLAARLMGALEVLGR